MPPLLRRLLPPVLSAVLALAVAIPVTWYLATGRAATADGAPLSVPAGPVDRAELHASLLSQLPGREAGAVLLEFRADVGSGVGVPPGRYRVHLICGLLRRQGAATAEVTFQLSVPEESWRVVMPCPSELLTMADELDFTGGPAGAIAVTPEFTEEGSASHLVLLQLVPVTDG